jgi:hypothetical protein
MYKDRIIISAANFLCRTYKFHEQREAEHVIDPCIEPREDVLIAVELNLSVPLLSRCICLGDQISSQHERGLNMYYSAGNN